MVRLPGVFALIRDLVEHPGERDGSEFALATDAIGIWGGTTEQQRERMLGRRMSH